MLWRPVVRRSIHRHNQQRRHASFFPTLPALPSLTTFSELLLTHPYPTYTSTIILLTIAFRTGFTLPVSIWAQGRMNRMREIVRPEMQRVNARLAVEVAKESRRKGVGYDEYKKELKRQVSSRERQIPQGERVGEDSNLELTSAP